MKRNKKHTEISLPSEPKICPSCGAENDERLIHCRRCGARLKNLAENQKIVVKSRRKDSEPLAAGTLFRFTLILLLAIVTAVFAFLPTSVIKAPEYMTAFVIEDDLEVGLTPADFVLFFAESLIPDPDKMENEDDADAIRESKADLLKQLDDMLEDANDELSEEMESIAEDHYEGDSDVELTLAAKRICNKIVVLYTHREMINTSTGTPAMTITVAALASLYFVLLCLALLICAIRNLCAYVKGRRPRFSKCMSRICFVLAFIPVMFFTQTAALTGVNTELSVFSIISMALCAFVVLYVAIESAIRFNGEGSSVGSVVRKVVVMALCAVVMISAFIPTVSVTATTALKNQDEAEDVSIDLSAYNFAFLDNTHNEFEDYTELTLEERKASIYDSVSLIGQMTSKTVKEGGAKAIGGLIISDVLLGYADGDMFNLLYSAIPLITALAMLFAAIVIAQLLFSISTRNFNRGFALFARFFMIILSLVALAAIIAAVAIFYTNIDVIGVKSVALYIGAGNIVMAIAAIVTAFFAINGNVKKVYVGEGVENEEL